MHTGPMHTIHVRIEGRVQGVGYRAFVEMNAEALGLASWVRNRRDGSVEAVFQGEAEAVTEMLRLCRQGPPGAHVSGVEQVPVVETAGEGGAAFESFERRPTA
jgi:acylphosphatase